MFISGFLAYTLGLIRMTEEDFGINFEGKLTLNIFINLINLERLF